MDIFNSALTDDERIIQLDAMEMETTFHALDCMYEEVERNLSIMREQAELKVFKESGSYDDLAYLYTEAENEASQKKKGIIEKIANVIREIIEVIKRNFSNTTEEFTKEELEEEIEVPATIEEDSKKIVSFWAKLKTFIKSFFSKAAPAVFKTALKIALPVVAILGVKHYGGKFIRMKRKKVLSKIQAVKDAACEANPIVNFLIGKEDNDNVKQAMDITKKGTQLSKNWQSGMLTSVKKKGKKHYNVTGRHKDGNKEYVKIDFTWYQKMGNGKLKRVSNLPWMNPVANVVHKATGGQTGYDTNKRKPEKKATPPSTRQHSSTTNTKDKKPESGSKHNKPKTQDSGSTKPKETKKESKPVTKSTPTVADVAKTVEKGTREVAKAVNKVAETKPLEKAEKVTRTVAKTVDKAVKSDAAKAAVKTTMKAGKVIDDSIKNAKTSREVSSKNLAAHYTDSKGNKYVTKKVKTRDGKTKVRLFKKDGNNRYSEIPIRGSAKQMGLKLVKKFESTDLLYQKFIDENIFVESDDDTGIIYDTIEAFESGIAYMDDVIFESQLLEPMNLYQYVS